MINLSPLHGQCLLNFIIFLLLDICQGWLQSLQRTFCALTCILKQSYLLKISYIKKNIYTYFTLLKGKMKLVNCHHCQPIASLPLFEYWTQRRCWLASGRSHMFRRRYAVMVTVKDALCFPWWVNGWRWCPRALPYGIPNHCRERIEKKNGRVKRKM